MHFFAPTFAALVALYSSSVSAGVVYNLTEIALKRADEPFEVHCGTTSNAVASDCSSFLASEWEDLNWGRTCSSQSAGEIVPETDYNPICSPGNCCIYTNLKDMSVDDLKAAGNYIMGCVDTATNQVNGRASIGSEDTLVCLSDGKGCGDCFDD